MMAGDDDIAGALPRPPFPAPARREAAIAEALRRFDGGAERPPRAAEDRRGAWFRPGRPYAGALAGAFLVALVGLPFVWTSFDRYADGDRETRTKVEAPAPPPAMAEAAADAALPGPEAGPEPRAAVDEVTAGAPPQPRPADSYPVAALKAGEPPEAPDEEPAPGFTAPASEEISVTGSRIRRPDPASASPIGIVGKDDDAVTAAGVRARRGDWNACTIDDPRRDLRACRRAVNPAARGASGRAAAQVADGLSRGWEGDSKSAIAAFDRAIELAPRSSAAYLNRGLAWRRLGDLDRALADLDRAILHSPDSARGYYLRSLVLRQRGDSRRARADEERAVELDPSYAATVGAGRSQKP